MAKGIPQFYGVRLAQVREARGLSGVNLATMIDVSPASISQYERDGVKPTTEVLDRLTSVLNVPKAFFLRPVACHPEAKFFYRSMSAATKSARNRAESRFEWLREIAEYVEDYFDLPQVSLPELDIPEDFRNISESMIESYAEQCRRHWGLHAGPVPNVIRLLEKNGVVVSRIYLDTDTLDAFSENDSAGRPFVVLGAEKGVCVRSRFNAAHELAHIVLHKNVEQRCLLSAQDHKLMEQQAHHFAGAFHLPEEDFAKELIAATLDSFAALKERWKVSIAAMIIRCSQLGITNESQTEKLWINLGRRGWRKCEPLDTRLPAEQPTLLRQCFDMMLKSNFKTRSQIVDDLCLASTDIEELAGLPIGYLNDGFGEVISLQFKGNTPASSPPDSGRSGIIPFRPI